MIGVEVLGSVAAHSVKVMALVTVSLIVTHGLRRHRARARATVLGIATIGCLLLPVLTIVVPSVPLSVGTETFEPVASMPPTEERPGMVEMPARRTAPASTNLAIPVTSIKSIPWSTVAVMMWLILASVLVLRDGASVLHVHRRSRQATGGIPAIGHHRLRAMEGTGHPWIRLAATDALPAPSTHGWWRPTILVPTWCGYWLAERWDAVLAHELEHVRFGDWAVRLITRLVVAVNWFNPFTWLLYARLVTEQERAADEAVLDAGARASDYAAHLVALAHSRTPRRGLQQGVAAMAAPNHIEERIMRILNYEPRRALRPVAVIPAVLIGLALTGALAALDPADEPKVEAAPEELRQTILKIQETERRYQPQIEAMERAAEAIEEQAERIEAGALVHEETAAAVEAVVARHESRIAEMEAEMAPILERIEAKHLEMASVDEAMADMEALIDPLEDELEVIGDRIEPLAEELASLYQGEGSEDRKLELEAQIEMIHKTMEPILDQIHEAVSSMEPEIQRLAAVEALIEPEMAAIEAIQERYADDLQALEDIDIDIDHEAVERLHEAMEPFHEEMEVHHRELEGFHREMDELMTKLEPQLRAEVERRLRIHLGRLASGDAPFGEVAESLVDGASIVVDENGLEFSRSRRATEDLIRDRLLGADGQPSKTVTEAIDATVEAVCNFRLNV